MQKIPTQVSSVNFPVHNQVSMMCTRKEKKSYINIPGIFLIWSSQSIEQPQSCVLIKKIKLLCSN